MRRSALVETAHNALQSPDRQAVDTLLASVNLSLLEREIIIRSEIDKTTMEAICNTLENWNESLKRKHKICSYENCTRIKRTGMLKIGTYLQIQKV
jgi:hypothetical protein